MTFHVTRVAAAAAVFTACLVTPAAAGGPVITGSGRGGDSALVGHPGAAPRAVPSGIAPSYELEDAWPASEADSEPIGLAVAPDGTVYTVQAARRSAERFPGLVRRDASGTAVASIVVRDTTGRELRPLAVAATGRGLHVTTEDLVVALGSDGRPLWQAPAGDGRAEFGPAARGLARHGDVLYGTDLVNGRVLGYDANDGRLRLRLGTTGTSPGTYRAPVDVAIGAGGELYVADHGNRRIQILDPVGNPIARFALPAAPRALSVDADGHVFALLADERVLVLDPTGVPLLSFGSPGHGSGQLHLASDIAIGADGRVLVADRGNRRIQVFGPAGPPSSATPATPSPEPSTAPPAPPTPPASWSACPGRPATVTLEVDLPTSPPRVDVLLVFDTTGSMEGVIDTARTRALEIAAELSAAASDVAIGVLDVRDYPYGRAGMATDWPYALRGPLSTEPDALVEATGLLYASGGGDAPEAYAGAIASALLDERTGWRDGARKIVVLVGDSVPRDDDLNEGLTNPPLAGRWAPGVPAWWRDSGPDWVPGTADDIDWTALLATMRAADVTLVALVSGAAPEALGGRVDALVAYWRAWSAMAGPSGEAVAMLQSADLPAALRASVGRVGTRIDRLHVEVEPSARASWAVVEPREHRSIDTGPAGARRRFDVALSAPLGTSSGTYPIDLTVVGDGAVYARVAGLLRWHEPCAPEPTRVVEPTPTLIGTPTVPPTDTLPPTAAPRHTPTASPPPTGTRTAAVTPTRQAWSSLYLPRALKAHCSPGQRRKADVVLLLDTSSSMAGPKLEAAAGAAVSFVGLLALPGDHAAVVTFDRAARLAAPLTGSRGALLTALGEAEPGVGTRLDLGLGLAIYELSGPRSRLDATPVVVLLTDGRPDGGTESAARLAADRARDAGITVFAIGLGDDVDGTLLSAIATDPTRYAFAPDATELADIYARIAGVIPCGRP